MTLGESQVNLEQSERLTLSKVEGSKLLSIHEFAKVCRTTPRTLRFYEQKGLFKPAVVDAYTKYRSYHPRQARDFLKIKLLQNFHIPLSQINKTFKKNAAEDHLTNELRKIKEEIKEKEKEYKFLEKIKSFLFESDSGQARMTDNIFQTQTFGPYNLFCMKVEHGEYAKITEYIKTLWKEAKRLRLKCEPSEITFYLDNRYNPKNTPLEIALILKRHSDKSVIRRTHPESVLLRVKSRDSGVASLPRMTNKNFYFKHYSKTKALVFKYKGLYEYLILIYQKLFAVIEEQKINLKGLVFETYKCGPLNTKSKYDYETTIGLPI